MYMKFFQLNVCSNICELIKSVKESTVSKFIISIFNVNLYFPKNVIRIGSHHIDTILWWNCPCNNLWQIVQNYHYYVHLFKKLMKSHTHRGPMNHWKVEMQCIHFLIDSLFVLQYWNVAGETVDMNRVFTHSCSYSGTCIFMLFTHDWRALVHHLVPRMLCRYVSSILQTATICLSFQTNSDAAGMAVK